MSKFLIFVLSDIHFNVANDKRLLKKISEFKKISKNIKDSRQISYSLLLVPGDIAFSGKVEEYEKIHEIFSCIAVDHEMIMSPGNHDHDFSCYEGPTRKLLLSTALEDIDSKLIEIVTEGQKQFFDFEASIVSAKITSETLLSKRYDVDCSVSVRSLNTAWCSSLNEVGGQLRFPIQEVVNGNNDADFNISIMHHPLSWFEPENQKSLRNILRESSDLIITGHEHVSDSFKVIAEDYSNLLIETISFDDEECDENGFLVLIVEDSDVLIEKWTWCDSEFRLTEERTKRQVVQASFEKVSGFEVSSVFSAFLNDLGTGFSHPDMDELHLDDLFVYPNVRNLSNRSTTVSRESSRNMLENGSLENIILIGEECSGKTSLFKRLCKDAMDKGAISVFIDGAKIKKAKSLNDKKLDEILGDAYNGLDMIKLQVVTAEKIVFLDRFDEVSGDSKSLSAMLRKLEHHFDRVLVSVSDTYDISENQISGDRLFNDRYSRIQLLKLGFRLRYELIDKWNSLKSVCEESKKVLIIENDSSHKHINRIIGKNYIPSTPFFLLTMLQSMDVGIASDVNTSSYGYYYQYLITSSLGSASVKKENLDEIFNYIKELSYFYYNSGKTEHSVSDLWDFNKNFCGEYGLRIDCYNRLKLLTEAKVLQCSDEIYIFKYPYVYYFFIAKYLADNLNEERPDEIIKGLINSLDKRKSMDVLMFLTHHSKEKEILDKIVSKSKSLFSEKLPADLNLNSKFLEDVIDSIPIVNYRKVDAHEYRSEVEDLKDKREGEGEENDEEELSEKDESPSNGGFITEFNLAFKSLELLGQLSKNYYGSLKVDQKNMLLEEAIEAPLRAIESIFELMRSDPNNILYTIEIKLKEILLDQEGMTDYDVKEVARKVLFNMLFFITFNIIKKISNAVGSRSLIPVIESISDRVNTNAVKLINLSVKLDLGSHGSVEDLKKLTRSLEGSGLSITILRSMLAHYLYMFEVRDSDVRKICNAAGINYTAVSQKIGVENLKKFRDKSLSGKTQSSKR
jgi:predicted phosphohydrolase